jgi:uncharacterized protein (DUF1501 family)
MLNYLLAHPDLAFSPPETADLCEAFDMTLAELHAKENTSANWEADDVRASLAAEIVKAKLKGEQDPKALRDHAVAVAETLFAGR